MRRFRPLAILSATLLLVAGPVHARNDATAADWRKDLPILLEELEAVHPDPWFHASRDEVTAAAAELDARLDEMSWEESFTELHRLVAMLRDGHTRVQSHRNEDLHLRRVQIHYGLFPEGLHVLAVDPSGRDLLGGRVVRIGNAAVDEAIAAVQELVPADNEWTVRDRTPGYLTQADLLTGLGILEGPDACVVEVEKEGRTVRAVVPAGSSHDEASWPQATDGAPVPLYRRHPERSYFFEHLPEEDAVYLHFHRVRNDDEESFEDFCRRAFDFMEQEEVGKLVVDLRLNGGGNNFLNRPLIHGIIRNERVNQEGSLLVIVGRRTFSAAMCGTIDLERQTNALFVGEPTGASPNHHGDAVPIVLPHTGITVSISALFWQNSDPRDTRPWLQPDIPVELDWDDWAAGRDPVLEAALAWSGGKREPVAKEMSRWLAEGASLDEVLARYRQLQASDEGAGFDFGEYQLNAVGYELLGAERVDEAITVFELNVELFPHSFNPWDSLGEAYAHAGRSEDAIAAYRCSVELNPASRSGQSALRRLLREAEMASAP